MARYLPSSFLRVYGPRRSRVAKKERGQYPAILTEQAWSITHISGGVVALRPAHEATSPCNKLWGQVPSCELAIFASKSCHKDLVPATSPMNSNCFEF